SARACWRRSARAACACRASLRLSQYTLPPRNMRTSPWSRDLPNGNRSRSRRHLARLAVRMFDLKRLFAVDHGAGDDAALRAVGSTELDFCPFSGTWQRRSLLGAMKVVGRH